MATSERMVLLRIIIYIMIVVPMISCDISTRICWQGGFTAEYCCSASPNIRLDCWADHMAYNECCPNADCWPDNSIYNYELCCSNGNRIGAGIRVEHPYYENSNDEEFHTDKLPVTSSTGGNPICWNNFFNHEKCCKGVKGFHWYSDQFSLPLVHSAYTLPEYYSDAQYGPIFGYYSQGRVISSDKIRAGTPEVFSQYTTYPMAMSPYFGYVVCKKIYRMWLDFGLPEYLPVVEMGAGSGQLAVDIHICVRNNILGIKRSIHKRFAKAMQYIILEFSESLVLRQRERGLTVVHADAQEPSTCSIVRNTFRYPESLREGVPGIVLSNELLDAFEPTKLRFSLEFEDVAACDNWSEVLMIQVLPRDSLFELCEEIGLDNVNDYVSGLAKLNDIITCGFAYSAIGRSIIDVFVHTIGFPWNSWNGEVFVNMENTEPSLLDFDENTSNNVDGSIPFPHPTTLCLIILITVSRIWDDPYIHMPTTTHNLRLSLRLDSALRNKLTEIAEMQLRDFMPIYTPGRTKMNKADSSYILISKHTYRDLRELTRNRLSLQIALINITRTYKIYTSILDCDSLRPWLLRHQSRNYNIADMSRNIGRSFIQTSYRRGEENYIKLADCILNSKGYILSIDYGASYTALTYALSSSASDDGVAVPPIPLSSIPQGLPDECQSIWYRCPGFVDLTSFVDFTNVAVTGKELGYEINLYGPQNILEGSNRMYLANGSVVTLAGVPQHELSNINSVYNQIIFGVSCIIGTYMNPGHRHVKAWYGNEEHVGNRFTSFKVLIMKKLAYNTHSLNNDRYEKSSSSLSATNHRISEFSNWHRYIENIDRYTLVNEGVTSWHLTQSDMNIRWDIDPTEFPQADLLRRFGVSGLNNYNYDKLTQQYSEAYENYQIARQLIDFPQDESVWVSVWGSDRINHVRDGLNKCGNIDIISNDIDLDISREKLEAYQTLKCNK